MKGAQQAEHQREDIQIEPKISMVRMGTERKTNGHDKSNEHNHRELADSFLPVGSLGELVVLPAQPFHRGKYSAAVASVGVLIAANQGAGLTDSAWARTTAECAAA